MKTLNVLTLKITNKYSAEYVNRLYKNLKKHTTIKFNFFCYTEDANGLDEEIQVIPLVERDGIKRQWYKIDFHNMPQFQGEKCLILDIDVIPIANIDSILSYDLPDNYFGGYRIWWWFTNSRLISGGFQMFYQGQTKYLYDLFNQDPLGWQEYYIKKGEAEPPVNGEQNFVTHNCPIPIIEFPRHEYVKYAERTLNRIKGIWKQFEKDDYMINGKFNDKIKLVHFANANNYIENDILGRNIW